MANCLQLVLSNATAGKDAEYNEWYGQHHLYTTTGVPGILAGQRFERVAGPWPLGKHAYLCIWELDDPPYALEQLAAVKFTDRMPISDAVDMVTIQPPTVWSRATVRSSARIAADSASRGTCVLMAANAVPGEEAAFEKALLTGGLADLADRPGVVSAEYLTLADEQIRNNTRKYREYLLFELSDPASGVESLRTALPNVASLDAGRWFAEIWRPLGPRVTKLESLAHQGVHEPA